MSQIVDLILPEGFDKEKAIKELDIKYNDLYADQTLFLKTGSLRENNFARNYVKELDEIENSKPVYDSEFWGKIITMNRENFEKVGLELDYRCITTNIYIIAFFDRNDLKNNQYTTSFNFHELDLINKQYRLLQEIYYSRKEN